MRSMDAIERMETETSFETVFSTECLISREATRSSRRFVRSDRREREDDLCVSFRSSGILRRKQEAREKETMDGRRTAGDLHPDTLCVLPVFAK